MEAMTTWKGQEKDQPVSPMAFEMQVGSHIVAMDASSPVGRGMAATPKQLLLAGITGCTGMDVISYLRKYREVPSDLKLKINVESSEGKHPAVFEKATLVYDVTSTFEKTRIIEAVEKSMTRYCGVSAMLSRAFPIEYEVYLNGVFIVRGKAQF